MTVYHSISCIIHHSTVFILCLAPPSGPPPSLPLSPGRAADVRLPPVAAAASSSRWLFTQPAATAALNTAVRWHAGFRCGPHQSHTGATANSHRSLLISPKRFHLPSFISALPSRAIAIHLPLQRRTESTKERKYSSLTGEKNTCEINLGCGRTEMIQQLLNLLLWHWLKPKQLFFSNF